MTDELDFDDNPDRSLSISGVRGWLDSALVEGLLQYTYKVYTHCR